MKYSFTQYACCTCEWALWGNLCKHQIVVIFTCTYITQEDIIEYCGTWYGYECGGLATVFANWQDISDDGNSFNDGDNEFIEGEEGIIDIGGITITNENEFNMDNVGGSNEDSSSNVPMERAIVRLGLYNARDHVE